MCGGRSVSTTYLTTSIILSQQLLQKIDYSSANLIKPPPINCPLINNCYNHLLIDNLMKQEPQDSAFSYPRVSYAISVDRMDEELQKQEEGRQDEYYSLQNMVSRGRMKIDYGQGLNEQEWGKIMSLSAAVRACFELRGKIQNNPFGYFFKYPCNPYTQGLTDYWKVVRRPMDLTTIKRKFILGIYTNHKQFDQDMHLMFNNALLYNKHSNSILVQVNELLKYYQLTYKEIEVEIGRGGLSEVAQVAQVVHSRISQLNGREMERVFSQARLQKLGRLLSSLVNRRKRGLVSALTKKYPNISIYQKENQQIYLNKLNPQQLYDLLKFAKNIRQTDFDTAKLMSVPVDPLLEGYEEREGAAGAHQSAQESQFQIEDQSD